VGTLSRSQLLVYGAVGVALLLLGARWIRAQDAESAEASGISSIPEGPSMSFDGGGGSGDLVVHVAGEVREPGVFRLPLGSRVTDAVQRAGGATADASLDSVNLAAELADGQQVVVPGDSPTAAAAGTAPTEGPIGLGTATVEQLDTIEGIGPVTAEKIIEFRSQNGGVSSVEDLDQISGIGPATMEALRSSLQP
jgi:competence protein ComEA